MMLMEKENVEACRPKLQRSQRDSQVWRIICLKFSKNEILKEKNFITATQTMWLWFRQI